MLSVIFLGSFGFGCAIIDDVRVIAITAAGEVFLDYRSIEHGV